MAWYASVDVHLHLEVEVRQRDVDSFGLWPGNGILQRFQGI